SGAQLQVLRIVRRLGYHRRRLTLAEDLDRQLRARRRELGAHVADGETLLHRVPVVAGGGPSDHAASFVEQWLVAERIGIAHFVHLERDEAVGDSGGQLSLEGFATNERALLYAYEAVEARLERRVVGSDVAAPHAVGLLEAQRFHGPHAHH